MQFPKVSLGSFCTDFGATIHCLTLSQRDVALRRGVHVQSLRMHPRAVKKGSEVPPYLPSQSLRAVKELLPLSPYLLGYIRSRLSSLRSYSGPKRFKIKHQSVSTRCFRRVVLDAFQRAAFIALFWTRFNALFSSSCFGRVSTRCFHRVVLEAFQRAVFVALFWGRFNALLSSRCFGRVSTRCFHRVVLDAF